MNFHAHNSFKVQGNPFFDKTHAVILIDTMLSLAVFSVAILTTLAMLGGILHAQAQRQVVDGLEQKMQAARQVILETAYSQVVSAVADAETWQITPNATATASSTLSAEEGLALEVTLTAYDGTPIATFGAIKTP